MSSSFSIEGLDLRAGSSTFATTATNTGGAHFQLTSIAVKVEPFDPSFSSYPNQQQQSQPQQIQEPQGLLSISELTQYSQNVLSSQIPERNEQFRDGFAEQIDGYGNVTVMDTDSLAMVPASDHNNAEFAPSPAPAYRKPNHRSSELVRATHDANDVVYFRDLVRRTRMVYSVLKLQLAMEDYRRRHRGETGSSNFRHDLSAGSRMQEKGLWLHRNKRIVGSIPGIEIGDMFLFRMEMCVVGLHSQTQAGIDFVPISQSSNGIPIATSIIFSGGYEDDEDGGNVIIYTGHGGHDKSYRQVEHQKLEGGNLALERSKHHGIEVRVIRGFKYDGWLNNKVYVYDGLYKIVDSWPAVGKSGFTVYKYKLLRLDGQPEMGSVVFEFAKNLRTNLLLTRPVGYLSLDLSKQTENMPVLLFNDIDEDNYPLRYEYLNRTLFPPFVTFNQGTSGIGCRCVSPCIEGSCYCAVMNGGEFSYDQNGHLLKGKAVIFECGQFCGCPPSCSNRVTQKGLGYRLEVFRSLETGWGVRSLDLIQAGSFICEYVGVVLTSEQSRICRMNGDSLVYPSQLSEQWERWGDLSMIYSDYSRPSFPSIPPVDFSLDVSSFRNVACYISHSLCPNVVAQFVLFDHNNAMFPRIMLFAIENIPPLRDLGLDYGIADEWTEKLTICN